MVKRKRSVTAAMRMRRLFHRFGEEKEECVGFYIGIGDNGGKRKVRFAPAVTRKMNGFLGGS